MDERDIFLSALEIEEPAARMAWLAKACGADHELRARLDARLASHADAGDFLAVPAVKQIAAPADAHVDATLQLDGSSVDSQKTGDPGSRSGAADATEILHPDAAAEIPLTFLQPSTREHSLGRLG